MHNRQARLEQALWTLELHARIVLRRSPDPGEVADVRALSVDQLREYVAGLSSEIEDSLVDRIVEAPPGEDATEPKAVASHRVNARILGEIAAFARRAGNHRFEQAAHRAAVASRLAVSRTRFRGRSVSPGVFARGPRARSPRCRVSRRSRAPSTSDSGGEGGEPELSPASRPSLGGPS